MWNLKNEQRNKKSKSQNRLIDTENKLVVARGKGSGEMAKVVKWFKRYKLSVI